MTGEPREDSRHDAGAKLFPIVRIIAVAPVPHQILEVGGGRDPKSVRQAGVETQGCPAAPAGSQFGHVTHLVRAGGGPAELVEPSGVGWHHDHVPGAQRFTGDPGPGRRTGTVVHPPEHRAFRVVSEGDVVEIVVVLRVTHRQGFRVTQPTPQCPQRNFHTFLGADRQGVDRTADLISGQCLVPCIPQPIAPGHRHRCHRCVDAVQVRIQRRIDAWNRAGARPRVELGR